MNDNETQADALARACKVIDEFLETHGLQVVSFTGQHPKDAVTELTAHFAKEIAKVREERPEIHLMFAPCGFAGIAVNGYAIEDGEVVEHIQKLTSENERLKGLINEPRP